MWTVKVIGYSVLAISVTAELLGRLHRRYRARKILNEVLFFPSELACVEHIFSPSLSYPCYCALPHGVETSFSRLLRHILSASSSLDLCVFAFSNMDLCRAVLALHSRGVIIRVLSDKDYTAISGSQIGPSAKQVRTMCFLYSHNQNPTYPVQRNSVCAQCRNSKRLVYS
uniref:Mitochondrial cardiolipin hydrolase n=1 Tax=Neogobius melanostomus TaxID=47308 RepID=A0A8C6TBC8_9GOBI